MNVEAPGARGSFPRAYTAPPDVQTHQEMMFTLAAEGIIDAQLLSDALGQLEQCTANPALGQTMVLRTWHPSAEAMPRRGVIIDLEEPVDDEQEVLVDAYDMPPDTHKLIDLLYRHTGASIVRDDLAEGEQEGVVIRRAAFHGVPVYFRETYDRIEEDSIYYRPDGFAQHSLGIEIMGEARGIVALAELSLEEKRILADIVGPENLRAYCEVAPQQRATRLPLIHRENLTDMLDLIETATARARRQEASQKRFLDRLRRFGSAMLTGLSYGYRDYQ